MRLRHLNVSFIVRDKVTLETTPFEERAGEPRQNRTKVLLLTGLAPYRQAKRPTSSLCSSLPSYGYTSFRVYECVSI